MPQRTTDRRPRSLRRPSGVGPRSVSAIVVLMTLLLSQAPPVWAQPPSPNPDEIGRAPETVVPGDPFTTTNPTWEYRTLFVTWDSGILNWVADFSDGTRLEGLDAILNNEGRNGWELVTAMPEQWTQIVDDAIIQEVRRMRLFLKKPLG